MTQFTALLLTLVIEGVVYLSYHKVRDLRVAPLLSAGLCASLLTHPVAWLTYESWSVCLGAWTALALVEILVWITEAIVLGYLLPLDRRQALRLSLWANTVSLCGGLLYAKYGL